MSDNDNNNTKKPKATIEPIVISPEDKQKLDVILNSVRSRGMKHRAVIATAGGICMICGQIPSVILRYKLEDASIIERYCDKCVPK